MIEIIDSTKKANLQIVDSPGQAAEMVKLGKSDFALVIKNEKTESGQIVTDLLIDNSNYIVSGMFSPVAKAAIQLTSFEISSKMIQRLWDQLLPMRDNLQAEIGKVDIYLEDLNEAGQKIDSLERTISGIDISSLRQTLNTQSQNVESTRQVLQEFNSDYASFKADISQTNNQISGVERKLDAYYGQVSEQVETAQQYRDALNSYEAQLDALLSNPSLPPELESQVQSIRDEIHQTNQQIDASVSALAQAKADIWESKVLLASMKQKLGQAEAKLDSEKQALDNFNGTLNQTTNDLSGMNQEVGSLAATIDEVNTLIAEAKETKTKVAGSLDTSRATLQTFTGTISQLSDFDPAFLSRPVQAFEKELYQNVGPLTFIIPVSLALVLLMTCLLLTSVSVISEKNEGIFARMKLSTTSPLTIFLGKIIGQMVFGFLASFIILSIGILVFGISFHGNSLEVLAAIAISSFAFIALGLFMTNFANTQSAAILGSLIIILPMIFLSGTMLPLQLMSPGLQFASTFLPLTASNKLLLGVLIKGLPLAALWDQVLILIVPAVALTGYTIKRF